MKSFRFALLLTVALLGCSSPPQSVDSPAGLTAEDETAIRSILDGFDRAFAANDMTAAVTDYADDYVEMRSAAIVGREAAQEVYEAFTITFTATSSTVMRLEGVGNLAYAWTTFENRYDGADGAPRAQSGNTLWVLKKNPEGRWQVVASGFQAASRPDTTGA